MQATKVYQFVSVHLSLKIATNSIMYTRTYLLYNHFWTQDELYDYFIQ